MAGLEEANYKEDPRYQQMEQLKQAVQGNNINELVEMKHFCRPANYCQKVGRAIHFSSQRKAQNAD
jgi:hypothetical protein